MRYDRATITKRSGKKNLYACVTVPLGLRAILGRKQIYKTLGTYDKNIARRNLANVEAQIYHQLDELEHHQHPLVLSYIALDRCIRDAAFSVSPNVAIEIMHLLQFGADYEKLFNESHRWKCYDDISHASELVLSENDPDLEVRIKDLWFVFDQEFKKVSAERYAPRKRGVLFKAVAQEYFFSNDFFNSATREKTKDDYRNNVQKFMTWAGDVSLTDFEGTDGRKLMSKYADELVNNRAIIPVFRGTGVSAATLGRHFAAVKAVLNFAFREGYTDNKLWEDYQDHCKNKGAKPVKPIAFSQSQIVQLLAFDKPDREQLLFQLCIGTGCRLDEIALLTWSRICEETVDGQVIPFIDLMPSETVVKRETSHRRIPLVPEVFDCLPIYGNSPFASKSEPDRLFDYGKRKDGKTEAASKAGMRVIRRIWSDPRLVNHSFRHFFINKTREVEEWMSPQMANYITGHKMESSERSNYGDGYSLKVLYQAMCRMDFSFLKPN